MIERKGRPYTEKQLEKLTCHVCPRPAKFQWNACADGNVWRPLCEEHDVQVNVAVLKILAPKSWKTKIREYCKSINYKLKRGALS